MEKGKQPFVIVIAAVSGGGKTTITTRLNATLQNSKGLYFDEYDFDGPEDIINWVDNGANYDEWNLTPLIRDLKSLLTESLDYVVLDFPFAYKHSDIKDLIDLAVFIDTPLDIAMARRLIRDHHGSTAEDIIAEMSNYILHGRRGYLEMLNSIKPDSDIIVDGTLTVAEIINVIIEKIDTNRLLS
ncbi:hypothetical protein M3194_30625 [Paenibacillus glycanilyticus]|uniref:hypothetical protein n=1 Tax=Paenibacillus glycanilyticus TaxID=126569 RepID=UPI00203EDF53|nr:hypothetical protein [Paenibacillus glycanilyticus]MCM3631649.1 hypothetical protein [Paenibacillus glycanilyticus]